MGNSRRSVRRGLVALGIVGLFGASISARTPEAKEPIGPALASAVEDPTTGAVLIDLDDGIDEDEVSRIEKRLREAIAPYAWTGGLGEELSDEANLYRLSPPASEVEDVLSALHGDPDVEAVERERIWTIPDGAAVSFTLPSEANPPAPSRGGFTPNDPYYKHQWHMDQIQMPAAWASTRRGEGAVVAIIDTGVLYRDHGRARRAPDLANTRFVEGYDFVDNDA
ncbi:MAG: hypothetical protein H5U40_10555, partial [Polyangiaceae bacterium]|nr:hypothetical protein [Polyangiaceae bacterium]